MIHENNHPPREEVTTAEDLPDKVNVIGVSFRDSNKVYYFAAGGVLVKEGDHVIVETARGVEYGKVTFANTLMPKTELVLPLKKVTRAATEEDDRHLAENRRKEEDAFAVCQQKIGEHGLDMKLIDVEYTFDNAKLLFYFTSDDRVDFRELVKDLASTFRTRIELRQIGIRDETKLMGGLGVCYREYCCHSFLNDFTQVSIKMAKEQGLSLNSAKISGACGRLMCCLRFEHETYQEEIKRTPKVGAVLVTPDGTGTVIESKPLVGMVKVRLDADPEGAPKIYDRDLVRPKTAADEITKRGEKVERAVKPVNVPFTPLAPKQSEDSANAAAPTEGKSSKNRGKPSRGPKSDAPIGAEEPSGKNVPSGSEQGARNSRRGRSGRPQPRSGAKSDPTEQVNRSRTRGESPQPRVKGEGSAQPSQPRTKGEGARPAQPRGRADAATQNAGDAQQPPVRNVRVNNGKVDKYERPPKQERPESAPRGGRRNRSNGPARPPRDRKGEGSADKKSENQSQK